MKPLTSRLTLLVLLITLALLFSLGCCGDCFLDAPTKEHPPYFDGSIYFPLESQNYWRYSVNGSSASWVQFSIGDMIMWGDVPLYQIRTLTDTYFPEFSRFNEYVWFSNDTLKRENSGKYVSVSVLIW